MKMCSTLIFKPVDCSTMHYNQLTLSETASKTVVISHFYNGKTIASRKFKCAVAEKPSISGSFGSNAYLAHRNPYHFLWRT